MSVQLIRGSKWLPEREGARRIAWLVWIVWAVLLPIALVTVLRYARNIPIAEDRFMVGNGLRAPNGSRRAQLAAPRISESFAVRSVYAGIQSPGL